MSDSTPKGPRNNPTSTQTGRGQGQQKLHTVMKSDGTPTEDTGNGPGKMTQEEWRNRDKSQGLQRVDEETGELTTEDTTEQ